MGRTRAGRRAVRVGSQARFAVTCQFQERPALQRRSATACGSSLCFTLSAHPFRCWATESDTRRYLHSKDHGKLGIVRSDDHASVPAYLAAINDANSVRLVDGQAQLVIAPHASAQFAAIPLGDKVWKATLLGSGASQLTVHPSPTNVACASCVRPDANGSGALTVENTSNQPATLASIRLEKNGEE